MRGAGDGSGRRREEVGRSLDTPQNTHPVKDFEP